MTFGKQQFKKLSPKIVSLCSPYLRGAIFIISLITTHPLQAQPTNKLQSRPLYQTIQQAVDTLTRAEIAREEAALTTEDYTTTRPQIRDAIAKLKSIDAQLTQLLQDTYKKKPSQLGENDWTVQQLESLLRNLQVHLARAYRNQALCYPANSADRINALSIALEKLPNVVTLPLNEAIVWQARLEQIVCLRLIKRTQTAQKQITRWLKASPPTLFASRLDGQLLRIALDKNDTNRALALLKTMSTAKAAPETDDAILETLLAARHIPQAIQQVEQITQTHGPYWQRRAEIRLGRSLSKQTNTDDPRLLGFAAASLVAADKPQQAIELYDRIAKLYQAQGNTEQAFEAQSTAAALSKATRSEDALTRFRELALNNSQHAEAASLHMIAIGLTADQARTSTSQQQSEQFEYYLTLLQEHLQNWPKAPSASTVQQWLNRTQLPEVDRQRAQTLAALGKRDEALALYHKLQKESPNDANLLEAYAKLLATGTDKQELRAALTLWHTLEKRSKPGSLRWKRGRQARLELLDRLGEGEQAKRLRQLTELLYE